MNRIVVCRTVKSNRECFHLGNWSNLASLRNMNKLGRTQKRQHSIEGIMVGKRDCGAGFALVNEKVRGTL